MCTDKDCDELLKWQCHWVNVSTLNLPTFRMDAPDSTCGVITPLRTIIDESWLPLLFRNIFIPYTRWRCLDHFSFRQPMESVYSFLLALHLLNKTCKARCSLWGVKSCSVQVSVFFLNYIYIFFFKNILLLRLSRFNYFIIFLIIRFKYFFSIHLQRTCTQNMCLLEPKLCGLVIKD